MAELKGVAAFPLVWPDGWKRENGMEVSKFKTSTSKAYDFLKAEVMRLGGENVVISTNLPIAATTGRPRLDRAPVDPGVAVYFTRKKKGLVFACDRYDYIEDNFQALGKTIEAIRGIERWGASDLMERAFSGFKALDAGKPWWDVLGCKKDDGIGEIKKAYREAARVKHPDNGGSHEAMSELNKAFDDAQKERAL